MSHSFVNERLKTAMLCGVGLMFFLSSVRLIEFHLTAIAAVREDAIPLLAELPSLERRREVLAEQLDLAQLHAAMRVGSFDEQIHMHVVPKSLQLDRAVGALETAAAYWEQQQLIGGFSAVEFGAPVAGKNDMTATPVRIAFTVREDALPMIQQYFSLLGLLTVSDALTDEERESLFERIESESPTGIIPLEQFLSTDLLAYGRDAQAYEAALRRAVPQPLFNQKLVDISEHSLLSAARAAFGGEIGRRISEANLWPLPIMTLESFDLQRGAAAGWWSATVTLHAYERP